MKPKIKSPTKDNGPVVIPKTYSTALAPFHKLEDALQILNSKNTERTKKTVKRNFCRVNTRRRYELTHMSGLHYCTLIKNAILKQEWRHVVKLLLAYIDEPRSDKHTTGIIFKEAINPQFNEKGLWVLWTIAIEHIFPLEIFVCGCFLHKDVQLQLKIFAKYTLIYLLNDPVAHSMDILNEFLQLALSCQTETERKEFLNLLLKLPQGNDSPNS